MGFLDNLRDRFGGGYNDDDYEDDYYDDEYDDEEEDDAPSTGSGILGNTSRPEAESVSVYTRSGRPVGNNAGGPSSTARPTAPSRPSASYSSYRRNNDDFDDDLDEYVPSSSYRPLTSPNLNASGQLPPYMLRAEAYEDVQTVVRRVRTNQPVLLVLDDTPADIAQRILDFCFGLSFGIGGEVKSVDAKAFVVQPEGIQVSQAEIDRLLSQA